MLYNGKCKYMCEKNQSGSFTERKGNSIWKRYSGGFNYIYNLFLKVYCECMAVNYIILSFCASEILHNKNGDNRNLILKMHLASGDVLKLGCG